MIALIISGYLAWVAFSAGEVAGCSGGEVFDCGHVLTSQYAKVFGIPVSVPAFALYASLLGVLAFFRPSTPRNLLRMGWNVLTVGAIAAGLAAFWFIGIQVFELEHLCAYCLGAHSCGIVLAAYVLWKRPLGSFRTASLSGLSFVGVAALVVIQLNTEPPPTFDVEHFDEAEEILVADAGDTSAEVFGAPVPFAPPGAELVAPPVIEPPVIEPPVLPEEFAPPVLVEDSPPVSEAVADDDSKSADKKESATPPELTSIGHTRVISDSASDDSSEDEGIDVAAAAFLFFSPSSTTVLEKFLAFDESSAKQTEQVVEVKTPEPRLVTVSGKKFSLNTRHWPLLGDPDAKYIFVEMFDYTCPHCRNTHKAIDGAFDKYGDDLAIIALPVPLDGSCNDTVRRTSASHHNACELARIAVAVWRVDRTKFKEFHDWMFGGTRSSSSARAEAERLVGKEKLTAELKLPHAKDYISRHVDLYKKIGQGSVPKLMFPKSTMTGSVSSSRILCNTIERELAKK